MGKHLHLYKRTKLTNKTVYRCMKPDCSHFLHKELVVGKMAECPRCHEPFILSKANMSERTYPHCENCTEKKIETTPVSIPVDVLAQFLEKKGIK